MPQDFQERLVLGRVRPVDSIVRRPAAAGKTMVATISLLVFSGASDIRDEN